MQISDEYEVKIDLENLSDWVQKKKYLNICRMAMKSFMQLKVKHPSWLRTTIALIYFKIIITSIWLFFTNNVF